MEEVCDKLFEILFIMYNTLKFVEINEINGSQIFKNVQPLCSFVFFVTLCWNHFG